MFGECVCILIRLATLGHRRTAVVQKTKTADWWVASAPQQTHKACNKRSTGSRAPTLCGLSNRSSLFESIWVVLRHTCCLLAGIKNTIRLPLSTYSCLCVKITLSSGAIYICLVRDTFSHMCGMHLVCISWVNFLYPGRVFCSHLQLCQLRMGLKIACWVGWIHIIGVGAWVGRAVCFSEND